MGARFARSAGYHARKYERIREVRPRKPKLASVGQTGSAKVCKKSSSAQPKRYAKLWANERKLFRPAVMSRTWTALSPAGRRFSDRQGFSWYLREFTRVYHQPIVIKRPEESSPPRLLLVDGQGTRITFTNGGHQDVKELIADVLRRLNIRV